ncbi:hypothetical protein [Streptomyces hygroscopicus]|uniref:hypothetical protein n=1 Tax=Streptomyces hygroscopicus TaxID=1912 RepID=UPI001C65757B|nr:hypothetical protein [Streptomyces hygroscopicus]
MPNGPRQEGWSRGRAAKWRRRRDADARHPAHAAPGVPAAAAEREERARIRSEKSVRRGGRTLATAA